MTAPLADLLVLEIAEGWTGAALAGRLLADLGAEVVKVEPPDGDWLRRRGPLAPGGIDYAFVQANAGKRSWTLDLTTQADALLDLAARADALVHGGPPAALRALTAKGLRVAAPQLTICAVTPFGLTGPLADLAGTELTVQAASGIVASTGYADATPTRVGVPLAQHAAALFGVAGLIAALRSGQAQVVDVAAYDAMIAYQSNFLPSYFLTGTIPERLGNRHPHCAPWNTYQARDGWVVICTGSDSQWPPLLELLGRLDVRADAGLHANRGRVARVEEVDALVGDWTRERTVAEIVAALDSINIPAAPLPALAELVADEQFRTRRMVVPVALSDGQTVPVVGSFFKLRRTPGGVRGPAPTLGEFVPDGNPRARPMERPRERPWRVGRPLTGVRVLELTSYTAGPFAGRLLASLGAEVIKLEPPSGDPLRRFANPIGGTSYIFHLNNCDKRSVALDVDEPKGRQLLLELVRQSDVLIENFAPGAMERRGLGYETLAAANSQLIYCSVSGFGSSGPRARHRAYDTVIQAHAGIMSVTGWPQQPPTKSGISSADLLGATAAGVAILAALHERERSGCGQHVDLAMYDVAGWATAELWGLFLAGQTLGRLGNRDAFASPSNIYAARDGLVALSVERDEQWQALCQTVTWPALAADPQYATLAERLTRTEELDSRIGEWVSSQTVGAVVSRCVAAGVPAAPVHEIPAVAEHSHTRARDMIVSARAADGSSVRLTGQPIKLEASSTGVQHAAARLGADNEAVLCGLLGLSQAELGELIARGIVGA